MIGRSFSATLVDVGGHRSRPRLFLGDVLQLYPDWPSPVVIVSDSAYGVSGFPGDCPTSAGLVDWYRSHVAEWSKAATGETTLWFWNTEAGWATVHPLLLEFGWQYVGCNICGDERVRCPDGSGKFVHANQKPKRLIWRIIAATSEPGDVVWEPFGGLCTAAVVCADGDRQCYSAELLPEYHAAAVQRLKDSRQLRLV